MHRACAFHEDLDGALGMLGDRYTRVVDRLLAQPTTFIHGEFYPANILVNGNGGGTVNVCPIDWEMAGLGPALIDLACLLSGGWTDDQRADLAEAYYREIGAHGGDVPSPEHYLRTLDCCLIHLSVRNLGWSPDWLPPPGHAHDWLGDALRLSEKWPQ
jgi:aminoglycoside/choline kinase family phosphotransferase